MDFDFEMFGFACTDVSGKLSKTKEHPVLKPNFLSQGDISVATCHCYEMRLSSILCVGSSEVG